MSPPSGEAPRPLPPSPPLWQPWVPQWGCKLRWGRGLSPWEDAAGDFLVGKKRLKDPPGTGVCACERQRGKGGRRYVSPEIQPSSAVRGRSTGRGGGEWPARSLEKRGQLSGITCAVVCITDTHKFNKLINRILSCRLPLMVPIRATSRPFDL